MTSVPLSPRKSHPIDTGRRRFVRTTSTLSVLGAGAPLALNLAAIGAAAAQSTEDYRALVCVFLFGGNDQANTVVPTAPAEFASYADARPSLALPAERLTSLGSVASQGGRSFAMPVELATLAALYQSGRLAIVSNVGPLIAPTTLTQYRSRSVPLPTNLFSHNDQQSVWQSSAPEGATTGWGGRMAELIASGNAKQTFTAVSVTGATVFLSGGSVLQYQLGASGPVAIDGLSSGEFGNLVLQQLITAARPDVLENEYNLVTIRSIAATGDLSAALSGAPVLTTPFPSENPLADQLSMVARMISVRQALGIRRQVFFVALGGFDTHDFLLRDQPALHARIDGALAAFYQATVELGVADLVTAFTASDFGRTLTSNGDGSDHGWGSHHFVVGGAVRGGDIYGSFPVVALDTAEDVGSGRLLPTTSVDQYAATLARWFGVPDGSLDTVVPNLANFSTRDLGFMG